MKHGLHANANTAPDTEHFLVRCIQACAGFFPLIANLAAYYFVHIANQNLFQASYLRLYTCVRVPSDLLYVYVRLIYYCVLV